MATQFSVEDNIPWKKRFFSIWISQAISLLGSQLVGFALIWYLTVRTESATVLAVASMIGILPGVVLGPFIGPLIDRWNRRNIMLVADAVIALATVGLSILFMVFGEVAIWQIYILMFIRAVAGGFHSNALGPTTSLMVPVEHLPRVQGFNQMLNGGLNVIAAPLGAILYESLALQWILMIDVFTAIIAILPLFLFEIPQPEQKKKEATEETESTYWQEMGEGFRYIWNWKGLFILGLMAALVNFVVSPSSALLPLLIKNYYNGTVIQLGTFNSLFGVGVIVGGLLLGIWGGFKRRIMTSMVGLMMLGGSFFAMGILPGTLFVGALVTAAMAGLSLPLTNGGLIAILQAEVAPEMQGRVFTMISTVGGAMAPIGLAIAGPISDHFDIQAWYIVAGIVCVAMGIFGFISPLVFNIETNNPNKVKDETPEQIKTGGHIPEGEAVRIEAEK